MSNHHRDLPSAPQDFGSPLSVAISRTGSEHFDHGPQRHRGKTGSAGFPARRPGCTPRAKPPFMRGLIRVLDKTGRVIPAREFIDVVETSETGRQIDCLALEMGLETLAENPGVATVDQHVGTVHRIPAVDGHAEPRPERQPHDRRTPDPRNHRIIGHADAGHGSGLHGRPAAPQHLLRARRLRRRLYLVPVPARVSTSTS